MLGSVNILLYAFANKGKDSILNSSNVIFLKPSTTELTFSLVKIPSDKIFLTSRPTLLSYFLFTASTVILTASSYDISSLLKLKSKFSYKDL